MNASSKPFALSFSTSFFAFSCFLEAKTWIVYATSSAVAANGFVTAGSSKALGIFGDSTMEAAGNTAINISTMLIVSRVLSGGDPTDQKWMMSALYTVAGFTAYDLVVAKIVN